ncbi:MAG: hypothetical protein ACLT0Y_08465 [Christensenellales bacterium]
MCQIHEIVQTRSKGIQVSPGRKSTRVVGINGFFKTRRGLCRTEQAKAARRIKCWLWRRRRFRGAV